MKDSPAPQSVGKAAVLGAGVMGAAIAAHLANVGIPTLLLDMPAKPDGSGQTPDRNALVKAGLERARKSKPASFSSPGREALVEVGNFEDDLEKLGECDWVVEAVVENLEIKRSLYQRVAPHMPPHGLITSNTSGLSAAALSEALPEALRPRFLVTHFFNPPRYLKLLELVRGPDTHDAVVSFFEEFGDRTLGKGIVHAKDTPNFIANRVGCFGIFHALQMMLDEGYTVAEVDKLMGRAVGRPNSATLRTTDLVGLDTLAHVADNLYQRLEQDPHRDLFRIPDFMARLIAQGHLGEKTGAGFYKKVRGDDGKSEILMLDPDTLEYLPQPRVSFPSLEMARNVPDLRERIHGLVRASDRGGAFLWTSFSATARYAAACIPEIADDVVNVDRAMRWGFGWELGPFELWDAMGFRWACERMEAEGHDLPPLARELYADGADGFYRRRDGTHSFFAGGGEFAPVPTRSGHLVLADLKAGGGVILESPDASLVDLGDGVACLEFHTKMNTVGPGLIDMVERSLDEVEARWRGLVVGNDAPQFSAGANLLLILNELDDDNPEDVEWLLERFQKANQRLRLSSRPVVAAPHGLTLGGGCEVVLGADAVVASLEAYLGLVEVGAGLIPAGGGCKELVRRADEAALPGRAGTGTDLFTHIRRIFETVGMGKVATSAHEAQDMGFLRRTDEVVANRDRLLHQAKTRVLSMDAAGYRPPVPRTDIRVVGDAGLAALRVGLDQMERAGFITAHDKVVGDALAWVLCGGDVSPSARVSEEYLLELEKEAFMRLCGEVKTLERMEHLLKTGKPLRN
ncbi:MAG TPA: 3-hydroxyacyl-CoA dehydrogenase/enoyl-CoA hydratase family protein [Longimicrobiales bacterium]|nr:3-hydroxyacyl-CoA dehydrogenase/enoyl-CoA hydratase family protein [Longimicrobiales bacterium]